MVKYWVFLEAALTHLFGHVVSSHAKVNFHRELIKCRKWKRLILAVIINAAMTQMLGTGLKSLKWKPYPNGVYVSCYGVTSALRQFLCCCQSNTHRRTQLVETNFWTKSYFKELLSPLTLNWIDEVEETGWMNGCSYFSILLESLRKNPTSREKQTDSFSSVEPLHNLTSLKGVNEHKNYICKFDSRHLNNVTSILPAHHGT